MAIIYPTLENIKRLKVKPTSGELYLVVCLQKALDDTYEVFFNAYLDGDRPDIIVMKKEVGVIVIEVKDWDLSLYSINANNKWEVTNKTGKSLIKSPQAQVFGYKKNLYDLHLPIIGLKRIINPNFYNLVHCFVYFHNARENQLSYLYEDAHECNSNEIKSANTDFKDSNIEHLVYEKRNDYLTTTKRQIQRDRLMSFCSESIENLVLKLKKIDNHVLFDDQIYNDFKRRLSPPEHTKRQGLLIPLSQKQRRLSMSSMIKEKIKGVAGCGKTTILASRAINANKRHQNTVLILTYNITLKNHIRDKISDMQGCRNFTEFEISNYHQFFNCQLNATGQDLTTLIQEHGIIALYDLDLFRDEKVSKYETILIDEVQDYQVEWIKIIRDNFLTPSGEMVLFLDDSQNIYDRNTSRAAMIAQGYGEWKKLTRSYRTSFYSPLNKIFKQFQIEYLSSKYRDTAMIETQTKQTSFAFQFNGLIRYEQFSNSNYLQSIYSQIQNIIAKNKLHPNDILVTCSQIYPIRALNELFIEHEKTHCMFETYEELSMLLKIEKKQLIHFDSNKLNRHISKNKPEIERVRRTKKSHFYTNTGNIKISTTHSFKGLEAKTVFYLMLEDDSEELVYTSITRSTENLVVLDIGGQNLCSNFLLTNMSNANDRL